MKLLFGAPGGVGGGVGERRGRDRRGGPAESGEDGLRGRRRLWGNGSLRYGRDDRWGRGGWAAFGGRPGDRSGICPTRDGKRAGQEARRGRRQDTKVLPYGGGVRERPVDRLGTRPTKKGGRPGQEASSCRTGGAGRGEAVRVWCGAGRLVGGVEVPFDSVLRCRTSLRTGSSASVGMTGGGRQRPGQETRSCPTGNGRTARRQIGHLSYRERRTAGGQ